MNDTLTPPTVAPASVTPSTEVPSPAQEQLVDIQLFAQLKFRVAQIEAAEPVPKSKKLLKLAVDLGPLGKRQILAGIAQHYAPETLIGRKIVVVANLKPAMLMGLESQGMLLAASAADGSALAFLTPEKDMAPGSEVR